MVVLPEPNHRYDLTDAEQYGQIYYLSKRALNPFRLRRSIDELRKGVEFLKFNPNKDFLCLTGQSLIVALALVIFAEKYGSFQVLMFNAITSKYECKWFEIEATNGRRERNENVAQKARKATR